MCFSECIWLSSSSHRQIRDDCVFNKHLNRCCWIFCGLNLYTLLKSWSSCSCCEHSFDTWGSNPVEQVWEVFLTWNGIPYCSFVQALISVHYEACTHAQHEEIGKRHDPIITWDLSQIPLSRCHYWISRRFLEGEWREGTWDAGSGCTFPYLAIAMRTIASKNSNLIRACSSFTDANGPFLKSFVWKFETIKIVSASARRTYCESWSMICNSAWHSGSCLHTWLSIISGRRAHKKCVNRLILKSSSKFIPLYWKPDT